MEEKVNFIVKIFWILNLEKNYFDCILSMHTIYHIHKSKQKKVIEKLVYFKKNTPIVVVYSNPNTIIDRIKLLLSYRKAKKNDYYFFLIPVSWWKQFENVAEIEFYPWRSFSSTHQKFLIPDNFLGKKYFRYFFILRMLSKNFLLKTFNIIQLF